MVDIRTTHAAMQAFCQSESIDGGPVQEQPGIAIGTPIFETVLKKAIGSAAQISQVAYASTTKFAGLDISFVGSIDGSKLRVELQRNTSPIPQGEWPSPIITIRDITFGLQISVSGLPFSDLNISNPEINAGAVVSGRKLSLVSGPSTGIWGAPNELWRAMNNLPNGDPFTPALKMDWEVLQKAIQLLLKDELASSLIKMVNIPDLIGMIQEFEFDGPIRVGGATDLIMLTGPATWKFNCPRTAASPVLDGTASRDNGGVSVNFPSGSPEKDYPSGKGGFEAISSADIFVHFPKLFLERRFDGVVKPSVAFTDEGDIGPIHWHYEAAIALASVAVTLQASLQAVEFKVSLPSTVLGSAGAGVKIASVYEETAGLAFFGKINPLDILFRACIDASKLEIYFESRIFDVRAEDFQFNHWPQIEFPFDQIGDFVLARVAEAVINAQAGSLLSVTRFSILDFKLIKNFGKLVNALAKESAPDGSSVTLGVAFVK